MELMSGLDKLVVIPWSKNCAGRTGSRERAISLRIHSCTTVLYILLNFHFTVACEAYAAPILNRSKRKSIPHSTDLCSTTLGFFAVAMTTPTGNHSYVYKGSLRGGIRTDSLRRVNVNDPGLITLVNKLQDVFTTVGVCQETGNATSTPLLCQVLTSHNAGSKSDRPTTNSCCGFPVKW